MTRYGSQMVLPEIGETGQIRLGRARLLVVGAGGLGSTLLPMLVGAGVGHIHIMDDDVVEEANLHRQPLYGMKDIGHNKAVVAVSRLNDLNPNVSLTAHPIGAQADTAASVMEELCKVGRERDYLAVLDAADNFATTYMLSDLCQHMNCPLVSASAMHWMGYAGIFCAGVPSYRAVFPDMSQNVQDCRTAGVLGPVVGLIGMLQAQLCLSHILGAVPSPAGQLYRWDAKALRMSSFSFCNAREPNQAWPFLSFRQLRDDDVVIDVRSPGEQPSISHKNLQFLPLGHLTNLKKVNVPKTKRVVLFCQSGLRAARAAALLHQQGYNRLALLAVRHQSVGEGADT